MFLNILALLSAISISGVAAYYSIAGLTAIFSGAVIPIIIMGTVLEVGKIITTVWLHQNWNLVNFIVKWYLAIAVIVLMFITSMGIYGYLSKSHIETTSSVGDNTLLIEQIDQNIAVEQQRIKDNQNVIKQMDDAVNGLLSGSASNATKDNNRTATLATQATKLRDSQKKDRDAANKTIDDTNKRIQDLNAQKLKLNQAQLKVEAEVGPIKYIAQLIYGDNIDKTLLERAVRWVIIFIVAVFDPLAVSLVLGATMSMSWRKPKEESNIEYVERIVEVPVEKTVTVYDNEAIARAVILEEQLERLKAQEPEIVYKEIIQAVPIFRDNIIEKIVEVPTTTVVEKIVEVQIETIREVEKLVEVPVEVIREIERIVEVPVEAQDSKTVIDLTQALDHLLAEIEKKNAEIHRLRATEEVLAEELAGEDTSHFNLEQDNDMIGSQLPSGYNGQLFIIYRQPEILWKYNGDQWIQVDKGGNTSYTQSINWKHWQLGRLQRAEIEWDDMTIAEQQAIEEQNA